MTSYLITFSTRGLILDANKGDFVKVDKNGKVIRYYTASQILYNRISTKKF